MTPGDSDIKAIRKPWSRDEVLVAFNVYCRTPFGRLDAKNADIALVAKALGRTPGALAMKCGNLASLDPAQKARGISGLTGAAKIDRQVWEEFEANPEEITYESASRFAEITRTRMEALAGDVVNGNATTDKLSLVRTRVTQGLFRSMVLVSYGFQCAICRLPVPELLIASHIVPWSLDSSCRMDPRNGLSLCAIHDRAFDRGFIVVDDALRVKTTEKARPYLTHDIVSDYITRYNSQPILVPDRWRPSPEFLARHRALHQTGD